MSNLGRWHAYLYDKAGTFQAELPFTSLSVSKELNKIGVARLNVSYFILNDSLSRQGHTPDTLITSGLKTVKIYRNDILMFAGFLSEMGADGEGEDISLTLTFKSWLSYFQKRFVSGSYSSTDAGEIAWGLINTAQGETDGDIGITQGTITATTDRDRSYDDDEVALSITRLSANELDNGFDFEISDTKVFSVSPRLGTDKPQIVFDDFNTKAWRLTYAVGKTK